MNIFTDEKEISMQLLLDGSVILTNLLLITLCFFVYNNQNIQIFICDYYSIDYSTFEDGKFLCSGSDDNTIRVWDVETSKQIGLFNGHSSEINCVKFSPYHYYKNNSNVICSSSIDTTIRFWDVKCKHQLQIFYTHINWATGIEFSAFNGGRYLCSGSRDRTIHLCDVETSEALHVFNGHDECVWCVDISPLQSNGNGDNNKCNGIGVIGGNGYTICSGSWDKTVRIWDIETTKQLIVFRGHEDIVRRVKYGSNELGNTILSTSNDKSVRLWDIRSGQQIQVFNGHKNGVNAVEYSPFVVNNIEIGSSSNVICSGSWDNTIRFWDIRSNKNELYIIKGDDKEDSGILCLIFLQLKKKGKNNEQKSNNTCGVNLYMDKNRFYFISNSFILKFELFFLLSFYECLLLMKKEILLFKKKNNR
ncbi:G-protein beta WD-40 repeats containing protein [Reticulomyxa filosa]|uniref:G-protein beta WD-40 repeats containing protein n=1 Tax=Reticulomyxa filosa TaxID=46433 RepID=X6MBU5_RETFI|nr:G-protein beta WD-40 repeats containing protein [Reticulomyxa filosa]|eukprot:ETO10520.1 G-protein beta WD-40 repeats containing protein [Reticulomyxa filosa]